MMKFSLICLAAVAGTALSAEILVPVRTIRAREIISATDLVTHAAHVDGALSEPLEIVGKEALVALYPGRPVRAKDIGPPAIIDRNELVTLIFSRGAVQIATEGRALGRGAAGETLRVMNLTSRTTVTGKVLADGSIEVQ